jgi:hypothetical protein
MTHFARRAAVIALTCIAAHVAGQAAAAPPAEQPYPGATVTKPLYGDPAHPDFSGVWIHDGSGRNWADPKKSPPPLEPDYAARHKHYEDAMQAGKPLADTASECKALGFPRLLTGPDPIEIIQTPGQITFIQQSGHEVRRIFSDGRGHPEDPDPSFDGHSIGHWEGTTLVVDTVALRADTLMDATGVPHSDALHVTERWHRVGDKLQIDALAVDPKAFTKPWPTTHVLKRMPPDYEMMEDVCEDNNRNPTQSDGTTTTITK